MEEELQALVSHQSSDHNNADGSHDDELPLKRGQIITVLKTHPSNWWMGCDENGRCGFFPANYVSEDLELELPVSCVEPSVEEESFLPLRSSHSSHSSQDKNQSNGHNENPNETQDPEEPEEVPQDHHEAPIPRRPTGEFVRTKTNATLADKRVSPGKKFFTVTPKTNFMAEEQKNQRRRGRLMSQSEGEYTSGQTKPLRRGIPTDFRQPVPLGEEMRSRTDSKLSSFFIPKQSRKAKVPPAQQPLSISVSPEATPATQQPLSPKSPRSPKETSPPPNGADKSVSPKSKPKMALGAAASLPIPPPADESALSSSPSSISSSLSSSSSPSGGFLSHLFDSSNGSPSKRRPTNVSSPLSSPARQPLSPEPSPLISSPLISSPTSPTPVPMPRPLKKSPSKLALSLNSLLGKEETPAVPTSPTTGAAPTTTPSRYKFKALPQPRASTSASSAPPLPSSINPIDPFAPDPSDLLASANAAKGSWDVAETGRKRSSTTVTMSTLMNTGREISLPGFLLFDYRAQFLEVQCLGHGGGGEIWKGSLVDPKLIQRYDLETVAVKFVKGQEKLTSAENMSMFHTEVAVMWSLCFNPNVITLLGYCESPLAIITKLYPTDLSDVLHDPHTPLDFPTRFHLVKGLAKGLAVTHELFIAHRDVKPKNVLLDTIDGKYESVLCDFGLAAISKEYLLQGNDFLSVEGFSVRYAAPEVLSRAVMNLNSIDVEKEKKVDVYSFGVTIFEILTRTLPWDNLDRFAIEAKVRSGERPLFSRPVPSTFPHAKFMKDLMVQCWAQDPDDRPDFKKILRMIKDFEDDQEL